MTKTVATLGPSTRLIVFKFLTKGGLVSDCIPRLPINRSGITPTIRGKEVLPSTPNVWLASLQTELFNGCDYIFVGARADERWDDRDDVRFTFCRRRHLNNIPLHPNFVRRFDDMAKVFFDLGKSNLWTVMGHLNPYLNEDATADKGSVLMLDCNGRRQVINPDGTPVMVYESGREKPTFPGMPSQGIGPKVPLLNKASNLKIFGKKVQMFTA